LLPEQEKVVDRDAVLGTIRAVLALGFTISRSAAGQPADRNDAGPVVAGWCD
jgi:hypothetical protein